MNYASIQDINRSIMFSGLTHEQLDSVVMAVRYARSQMSKEKMRTINIGSHVRFYNPKLGREVQAQVTKMGRKYVTVLDKVCNTSWRVPANIIETA